MYAPPVYLLPILWIPGILYGTAVRLRNRLYASGVLKTSHLNAPVVSVGNITVGGTGKTPLVIHVANLITQCGGTPALLTRGYLRSSHGMRIIPPDMPAAAADVGDEPALVRRRCPQVWLGVHHDRYRSGTEIARACTNPVFILDDGFQHRRLGRDIDIVVIDSTQRLKRNRVMPLGSLREPAASLRRAGMVVVTGGKAPDGDIARLCPGASVFGCVQEIRAVVPLTQWRSGPDVEPGTMPRGPVFLVAGIGNPGRFLSDVQKAGLDVRGARWVRDHTPLAPGQWLACWGLARSAGAAAIVITEKDAVKISSPPDFPIFVAVQATHILDGDGFEHAITQLAGGGS